jgi:hypothetical protein
VARSDRFDDLRARAKAMAADQDVSVGTTTLVKAWLDACGVAEPRSSRPIGAPCVAPR